MLTLTVTPGHQFTSEALSYDLMNKLGLPTITLSGAVDASIIADNSITTAMLQANCVIASKILAGAVGTTQLASPAVATANLSDDVVTIPKMASAAQAWITGHYRNLNLATGAGADAPKKATVTAAELILRTAGGDCYRATSLNATVDITASGLNGLDTGAEASATWYYIWVVSDGATTGTCLSTSNTAPAAAVTATYPYVALVGAVYNDASSDFVQFRQRQNAVWIGYRTDSFVWTNQNITVGGWNDWPAGSSTTFNRCVPPIAKHALLLLGLGNTAAADGGCAISLDATQQFGWQMVSGQRANNVFNMTSSAPIRVPVPDSMPAGASSYKVYGIGPGAPPQLTCICVGYEL